MGLYEKELKELSNAGVKYVVIGGVALALHKYPRLTVDLDILPDLTVGNLSKVVDVMINLNYGPLVPVDPY